MSERSYPYVYKDESCDVYFELLPSKKKSDVVVKITKTTIEAGFKGEKPIIKGPLFEAVKSSECMWQIEKNNICIHVEKKEPSEWPLLIYQDTNNLNPEEIDPCSLTRIAESIFNVDPVLAYKYIKLASDKGLEDALYQLAHIYLVITNEIIPHDIIDKLPDEEKGLEILERTNSIWESEKSYITLGDINHSLKKFDEAIKWYKLCSELKGSINATLKLASLYNEFGNIQNALNYFESIADRSAIASINVALLSYPHDLEKVIKFYENTLRIEPSFDITNLNLPTLQALKESLERSKGPMPTPKTTTFSVAPPKDTNTPTDTKLKKKKVRKKLKKVISV